MNRSNVEEIKARLSAEDVIGSYVKLEKSGKSFKAKCPFHNEKTASFFVSPERSGYYCFGCGAKGDIFSFVEQFEGLDFRGALRILADKAGVKLTFDKNPDGDNDKMRSIMEEAVKYFESRFEQSKTAQTYVKERGINDETRQSFRIGWAPEGWTNLFVYLKDKGYGEMLIEKVGLIKQKERDGSISEIVSAPSYYDRFRGRIIFPINDSSGRPVAFSGRILKDDGKSAKYLNSPDTPLYDKSSVLYGLDKAKSEIRRLDYSVLVEGQMDLVMSHQAGVKNTLASSGTALTDEFVNENGAVNNIGLVRRLSSNIIIAFDSDAAGRKAAMRAAGIALGMGMDVKIADIVGGKDPADLIKENAEKWKNILRGAKSVIEFELDNVVREFADQRKLTKALESRVLPLIARIESAGDQSHFVRMVADRTKIPTDIVWQDLKIVQKRLKAESVSNLSKSAGEVRSVDYKVTLKTSTEQTKRIDIIERRLFGLMYLMEKENPDKARQYAERLKKIAGSSYDKRAEKSNACKSDLMFEAEAFFGSIRDDWDRQVEELIFNFEEDLIGEELISVMQELKTAERDYDGNIMSELVKKCQALSIRKAEIGKRRR